jgi:hypothetical protein
VIGRATQGHFTFASKWVGLENLPIEENHVKWNGDWYHHCTKTW